MSERCTEDGCREMATHLRSSWVTTDPKRPVCEVHAKLYSDLGMDVEKIIKTKSQYPPISTLEEWIKIGFAIEITHDNLDGYEVRGIRGRKTYNSDRSEWLDLAIESLARRLKREASIEE